MELADVGSQIKLRYRVVCQVTQNRIDVTAKITGGKYGDIARNNNSCYDNYVCGATVYMQDWSGSHTYNGGPGTGLYPANWTLAQGRDGYIAECDRNMSCERVIRNF